MVKYFIKLKAKKIFFIKITVKGNAKITPQNIKKIRYIFLVIKKKLPNLKKKKIYGLDSAGFLQHTLA